MTRSNVALWARDLAPALLVVGVASAVVSSQVSAAEGMLPLLVIAGVLAMGAAALTLHRLDLAAAASHAASAPPPDSITTSPLVTDDERTVARGIASAPRQAAEHALRQRQLVAASSPAKWPTSAVRALRFEPAVMSVPKLGNTTAENEDAYRCDVAAGRVVVADGASSSFASREWSHALCAEIVADPAALDSVAGVTRAAVRAADRWKIAVSSTSEKVAWWAQEGLERGAFATLVAVEIARTGRQERWRAVAVGDSCIIQLRPSPVGWRIVTSFPSEPGEDFGSHPDLVRTSTPDQIDGVRWAVGELAAGDVLIAATDAVSELALTHPDPAVLAILAEASPDELADEFTRRREAASMVNDDCTLVRVPTTAPLR